MIPVISRPVERFLIRMGKPRLASLLGYPATDTPSIQPTQYVIAETASPISSIRAPLKTGPRAVKIDKSAPTPNKAHELREALASQAATPDVNRYGATGIEAPTTNAKKELSAAVQGEPSWDGSNPNSSRAKVSIAIFGF